MVKAEDTAIDEIVVVLLSGGIDSTTAATMESQDPSKGVYFLTKKTDLPEFERALEIGQVLKDAYSNVAGHYVLSFDLENAIRSQAENKEPEIGRRSFDSLNDRTLERSMGRLGDRASKTDAIPSGYPGFRDEMFALIGLDLCERIVLSYFQKDPSKKLAGRVVLGTTGEDMRNFNDIRPEIYTDHINSIAALKESPRLTGKPLQTYLPFADMSKTDVIKLGMKVNAPLDLTWSCYSKGPNPCSVTNPKPQNYIEWCDQCHWRSDAFSRLGIADPALRLYKR